MINKKTQNEKEFTSLKDFCIEENQNYKLGSGSFASVILARSIHTNIQYAIKTVG